MYGDASQVRSQEGQSTLTILTCFLFVLFAFSKLIFYFDILARCGELDSFPVFVMLRCREASGVDMLKAGHWNSLETWNACHHG
jgi:hypothetical protein